MTTTTASTAATPSHPTIDDAELARLNQEMITSDLITPDRLYVDLALVKDFNIATLLSFLHQWKTTRPEVDRGALYNALLEGLDAYQNRDYDDIAGLFPAFGLTNEAIAERRRDSSWARHILHTAPLTPFIETLRSQIAVNVNHSEVIGKRDPIELIINIHPLVLEAADRTIVGRYFAHALRVNVKVVHLDVAAWTLADALSFDEIYTYYFAGLLDHADIRAGYETLKFVRKRLFVPQLLGAAPVQGVSAEQQELVVRTRFDVLTQFKFFPVKLCSAPVPPATSTPREK